ncbi:hypothetical protein LINGRAPRIM_LOCUS2004 [Linum grandiflorum]
MPNRCPLCRSDSESVDHLFIHCSFSSQVWYRFSSKLSIFGPPPRDIQSLIFGWNDRNHLPQFNNIYKVLLHAFLWFIWIERNDTIFREGSDKSFFQIAGRIAYAVCEWLSAFAMISNQDLSDFLQMMWFETPPD